MKLSVVVICWNDSKVIMNCLRSVYEECKGIDSEVIVTDNASSDGSVQMIREQFPQTRIVENGANIGFGRANNAAFRVAQGEYVLILNPDTEVYKDAIRKWLAFADQHPEAGGFGCRVVFKDGSYQVSGRPLPTLTKVFCSVLCLHWLGRFSEKLGTNAYWGWNGDTVREIGSQTGCALLVRNELLQKLGGFDERFFFYYEETDLCKRIWQSGFKILFYPDAVIMHLAGLAEGRSRKQYPIWLELEMRRSGYKYFGKHSGDRGVRRLRWIMLLHSGVRWAAFGLRGWLAGDERSRMLGRENKIVFQWNWRLDPVRYIHTGEEPKFGYERPDISPAPAGKASN